jgi:hypothetical protein
MNGSYPFLQDAAIDALTSQVVVSAIQDVAEKNDNIQRVIKTSSWDTVEKEISRQLQSLQRSAIIKDASVTSRQKAPTEIEKKQKQRQKQKKQTQEEATSAAGTEVSESISTVVREHPFVFLLPSVAKVASKEALMSEDWEEAARYWLNLPWSIMKTVLSEHVSQRGINQAQLEQLYRSVWTIFRDYRPNHILPTVLYVASLSAETIDLSSLLAKDGEWLFALFPHRAVLLGQLYPTSLADEAIVFSPSEIELIRSQCCGSGSVSVRNQPVLEHLLEAMLQAYAVEEEEARKKTFSSSSDLNQPLFFEDTVGNGLDDELESGADASD